MPLDASTDSTARKGMHDQLRAQGAKLFDRPGLMAYLEELRRNFYPERQTFTGTSQLGEDFASDLMTSFPVVARRDLGNTFSAMLRRDNWFKVRSSRPDREDTSAKQYLEAVTELQRNAMYDLKAGFVRATRETDHDFVTFGAGIIQHDLFRPKTGRTPHLLFRNRHYRDVAWCEGVTGQIDTIYRRDKPTALDLKQLFGEHKLHRKVLEKFQGASANPYAEINIWHVVIPTEVYREMPGGRDLRQPWVSLYIDVDNENHELECTGQWTRGYTIPRWQTVSGTQYPHSAAMVAALPDARLLQAVTLVLLEAGEKAVNPPTIATEDVVRSDIALYAGGTTWVTEEYDERLGAALRALPIDSRGLTFAMELVKDIRQSLRDATFLSKLDLPPVGSPEMTAYEVGQRVQEYIRNTLPLFEPVETDYSGALCDDVFELLFRNSPEMQQNLPKSLRGFAIPGEGDRQFEFESPLRAAASRAKAGQLVEAGQIITAAAQGDASVPLMFDFKKASRDALHGVAPSSWLRTEGEVERLEKNQQAQQQQERMLQLLAAGTKVAKTGAEAAAIAAESLPGLGVA